jgi:hypothetical protein
VSLDKATARAALVHRYSEQLLDALLEAEQPDLRAVAGFLDTLDDLAVEVETCRSELRELYPGALP